MRVPFANLGPQNDHLTVHEAIARTVRGGQYILGAEVAAFEHEWAEDCGAAESIALSSGTAALFLALKACGIGAGDEVAVPALTFAATAEAVVQTGAVPVFVDIDPHTYTMSPAALGSAITPRMRAAIPVHLFGHPADMNAIGDVVRGSRLHVIEDAAQAHGAAYRGQRCGSLSDAGCFSFFPTKNLGAVGDAGAVTTDDPDLAHTVRLLRNHGRAKRYEHIEAGWSERMDELQAAVLRAKLPLLAQRNARRREHAAAYTKALAGVVGTPIEAPGVEHVYHLYVVRVRERDRLLHELRESGVDAQVHYPIPLHRQRPYLSAAQLPETELFCEEALSLPLYPELTDEQREYVVERVLTSQK